MVDRTTPPSERAATREQPQIDAKADAERALQSSLRRAFSTPDGLVALKWIYDQCGYKESKVAIDKTSMELNPLATTYQAIRETLYINLRKKLTFNILKEVEYEPDQIS